MNLHSKLTLQQALRHKLKLLDAAPFPHLNQAQVTAYLGDRMARFVGAPDFYTGSPRMAIWSITSVKDALRRRLNHNVVGP